MTSKVVYFASHVLFSAADPPIPTWNYWNPGGYSMDPNQPIAHTPFATYQNPTQFPSPVYIGAQDPTYNPVHTYNPPPSTYNPPPSTYIPPPSTYIPPPPTYIPPPTYNPPSTYNPPPPAHSEPPNFPYASSMHFPSSVPVESVEVGLSTELHGDLSSFMAPFSHSHIPSRHSRVGQFQSLSLSDLMGSVDKLRNSSRVKPGKMQMRVARNPWGDVEYYFPDSTGIGMIVPLDDPANGFLNSVSSKTNVIDLFRERRIQNIPRDSVFLAYVRENYFPRSRVSIALLYAHTSPPTDLERHITLQIVTMALSGVKHLYIPQIQENRDIDPKIYSAYMKILRHYPMFDNVIFAADNDASAASLCKMIRTGVVAVPTAVQDFNRVYPAPLMLQPTLTQFPSPNVPGKADRVQLTHEFAIIDKFLTGQVSKWQNELKHLKNLQDTARLNKLKHARMPPGLTGSHPAVISVFNVDCVDAVSDLVAIGYNPLLVNFANSHKPCGGVVFGAGAQEEEICRKTTLSYYLMHNKYIKPGGYPMQWNEFRYTPFVAVLAKRDKSKQLHWVGGADSPKFLERAPTFGVISSAAFDLRSGGKPKDYEMKTKKIIDAHFATALQNGHDSIVTGAFGLGVFQGDLAMTIKIFKEVIHKYRFRFKAIVFAIVGGPKGNYSDFKDAFDPPTFQSRNRY